MNAVTKLEAAAASHTANERLRASKDMKVEVLTPFAPGPLTGRMKMFNDFEDPQSSPTCIAITDEQLHLLWGGDPRAVYVEACHLVAQIAGRGRTIVAHLFNEAVRYRGPLPKSPTAGGDNPVAA